MEMRASLFISSCFAVLFGLAQELDSTSVSAPASDDSTMILLDNVVQASNDSILVKKKFLSVEPYLDLSKLATIPFDFETKYEGGLELRFFEQYSFYAEVGSITTSPEGAYRNGVYESSGTYFRLGAGLVGPLDPAHDIGISFRYAISNFDETGSIFIDSPSQAQPDFVRRINRSDLSASWWELVLYSDRKLLESSDLLWFGLNLRLRILANYDVQAVPDVYAIPGYGRAFDKTIPAANFFLKVKF